MNYIYTEMNTRILTFAGSFLIAVLACLLLTGFIVQPAIALENSESHGVIDLTVEEKAWLAEHNKVKVAIFPLAPYQFKRNGIITGYQVDVLKAMLEKVGLEPEFSLSPLAEVLEAFKQHDADIALNFMKTKQRSRHLLFSENTFVTQMAIFAQVKRHDLHSIEALKDQRIASYKGYGFEPVLKRILPDARIIRADDVAGMLRLVGTGKADAAIQEINTGEYILRKNYIHNVLNHGEFLASGESRPKAHEYVVRNDLPQLLSILDKAYASIAPSEKQIIWNKWFSRKDPAIAKHTIHFTPQEQAWLAHNYTVQVRVADHKPYLSLVDGKPVGIAIDFINEISEHTGIKFHFVVNSPSFSIGLKGLMEHTGPDIILSLMPTLERQKHILFTKVYMSSPRFIFTRDDTPFISSIKQLFGKKVAVVKDYVVHNNLAKDYPNINLQLYNNSKDALEAVSSGKAFAFIGDIISVPHMITEYGLKNLKAVSPSGLPDHSLAIGVRNDWPELQSIISKGLAAIPPADKAAIINKWSSVKFDYGISQKDVWTWVMIVVIAVSGMILLFILWTKSLKKQVQKRTTELKASNKSLEFEMAERKQAEAEFTKSESKYRTLVDSSLIGVFNTDLTGQFIFVNNAMVQMYDFDSIEQMLATTTLTIWANLEEREHMLALLKENGRADNFEAETITLTGRHIHVLFSVRLLDENITGMVMDITERRQAEDALLESEERFRTLVTNTEEIIYMLAKDGTFLLSEGKGLAKLGLKPGQVVGKSVFELYKDYPDMLDAMRRAFNGETVTIEANVNGNYFRSWYTPHKNHEGNTIGLLGLSVNITEQKQAENKLQEYQQRLKSLAVQLTLAEEQERRRIAEDLHDHVGQSLAFTRMQLAAARKGLPKNDKRDAQFDDMSQALLKAIQDTRHLIFELSSPSLNELGLAAAIGEWMDVQIADKHGLKIKLFDHAQHVPLDTDLRAILFRNVRELLTNAIKHAQAKTISVWLESTADGLKITVQDDGVGFDSRVSMQNNDAGGGFGLFSVQERMTDLGGKLIITSQPGAGCKAVLVLPIQQQKQEIKS